MRDKRGILYIIKEEETLDRNVENPRILFDTIGDGKVSLKDSCDGYYVSSFFQNWGYGGDDSK